MTYAFARVTGLLIVLGMVTGCTTIKETAKETGKTFWGSSTRSLEQARTDAISKTYRCEFDQCFDAVESLSRVRARNGLVTEKGPFDIFLKRPKEGVLVVMGIKGNVDTTEVGIFVSKYKSGVTKIEVSSLSSSAKRRVAAAIFDELDLRFETAL